MWTPPPPRARSTTFQLAEGYADQIRQDKNALGMNIERGIDVVVTASLRASLSSLGKVIKAGLVDEDMPKSWKRHVERFNDLMWINFKEYAEEEVYEQRSLERKDHRRSLIASWATERKCWQRGGGQLPDPFGWLRARILYSLCPADATMWQVRRFTSQRLAALPTVSLHAAGRARVHATWHINTVLMPGWPSLTWQVGATTSFWVVLVLTVLPFYGISTYTYVGLFLIIERTDEYQLVRPTCAFQPTKHPTGRLRPTLLRPAPCARDVSRSRSSAASRRCSSSCKARQ